MTDFHIGARRSRHREVLRRMIARSVLLQNITVDAGNVEMIVKELARNNAALARAMQRLVLREEED